jgi:hypothetical protein
MVFFENNDESRQGESTPSLGKGATSPPSPDPFIRRERMATSSRRAAPHNPGKDPLGQIDAIGVDEIQYAKGHKYLTTASKTFSQEARNASAVSFQDKRRAQRARNNM